MTKAEIVGKLRAKKGSSIADMSDNEVYVRYNAMTGKYADDDEDAPESSPLPNRAEGIKMGGEEGYFAQHPIEGMINKAGNMAEASTQYNPAMLALYPLAKMMEGANNAVNKIPGVAQAQDAIFGNSIKGYEGLNDVADDYQYAKGIEAGASSPQDVYSKTDPDRMIAHSKQKGFDLLPDVLRTVSAFGEVLSPRSIIDLASIKAPGAIGGAMLDLKEMNAMGGLDKLFEAGMKSRLGRMGRGNVPYDEIDKAKSVLKDEEIARKQSQLSLQRQKEEALAFQAERDAKINQAQNSYYARGKELDEAERTLEQSLGTIETVGPRRMQVGMNTLDRLEDAQAKAKEAGKFKERYADIYDRGGQLGTSRIPKSLETADEIADEIELILSQPGDAKLKNALAYFKGFKGEEGASKLIKDPNTEKAYLIANADKAADFRTLLESKRALSKAVWNEYDYVEGMTPRGLKLKRLDDAIGSDLANMAKSDPELMNDLMKLNMDYSAYKEKFAGIKKLVKTAKTGDKPSRIPDILLNSEEAQIKAEAILGKEGFNSLRTFRTKQILSDIIDSVKNGEDPRGAIRKHFNNTPKGEANRALYDQSDLDAFNALTEDLHMKITDVTEGKANLASAEKLLDDLQITRDAVEPDFAKQLIDSGDVKRRTRFSERATDRPGEINRRRDDRPVKDRLVDIAYQHGGRLGAAGAIWNLTHSPKLMAVSLALGYGPEVMARAYLKSVPVRNAMAEYLTAVDKSARTKAATKLSTYMAIRNKLGGDQDE